MEEPIGGDWLLIGAAEMDFNPLFVVAGQRAQVARRQQPQSNKHQTANGDSSRAGQWDNSLGFVGVSSATYGTLTVGRMVSLSNEVGVAYDPTRSNAFSLMGNTGPFPRLWVP